MPMVSPRRFRPTPSASPACRRRLRPTVTALLLGALLSASFSASAAASGPEWAGEWVVWEGYQTGEETTVWLETYPTDLAGFEATLPDWAGRLRGLCDPAGRFYFGSAGGGAVLACEPSQHASGLWREGYALLGAMSQDIGALAPDPDLGLFGIGNESAAAAPFQTSPSDRYFWGHTITRTPTPEQPQGNWNTAGANDWHGRCMSGPCAAEAATGTTTGGPGTSTAQPTLEEELSQIRVEHTRECPDAPERWFLLVEKTPTRDISWFQDPLNISTVERIVANVNPGDRVTAPPGFIVTFYRWNTEEGSSMAVGGIGPTLAGGVAVRTPCPETFDAVEFWRSSWEIFTGPAMWIDPPWKDERWEGFYTQHIDTTPRGTGFIVEATEAETRVVVIEGAVEVSGRVAGLQTVEAGQETTSDGSTVADPRPTDPADLAARYPWIDEVVEVRAMPPELPAGVGPDTPGDEDGSPSSSFPTWAVLAVAVAAVAALGAGIWSWASRRAARRARLAEPPPPPAPATGEIPPPPPPPW